MDVLDVNKKMKKTYCLDCGKIICYNSIRCKSCSKKGVYNSFYGKKHTQDTKRKISEIKIRLFKDGKIKPNSTCFKKGHISWMKGRTSKIETKCLYCHKKILKIPYIIKNRKHHFCNVYCYTKFRYNKKRPEHSKRMSGEGNPSFKNWASREPYGIAWSEQFKEMIRKRDNYVCVLCNKPQGQEKLNVHHIDYIKTNIFPQNCISLCKHCHLLTNNNREHWKTFFQNLLTELYQYKYTEDQQIIMDFII